MIRSRIWLESFVEDEIKELIRNGEVCQSHRRSTSMASVATRRCWRLVQFFELTSLQHHNYLENKAWRQWILLLSKRKSITC
jgi:hypothetical protein